MLSSKKISLRPILESSNGVHLSAYIVNRGDLVDLKRQIRDIVKISNEHLRMAMSLKERNKFLEPLDSLLLDARIFREMKGNVGLFRKHDSFALINIPMELEFSCNVASTFYVKPLLKWLQNDQDFFLLGIKKDSLDLFLGSQDSLKHIDSILLPDFSCLSEWISKLTVSIKPKLFLAGDNSIVEILRRNLKYDNLVLQTVANSFGDHNVLDISMSIRKTLNEEVKDNILQTFAEYRIADEENRSSKNLFQISKAVTEGRVRKLIVTDEMNIFGTINKETGRVSIHPFDLNHEDDDILDDLAQMVLEQGGEVIVASRDEMPNSYPILAILDRENAALEKTQNIKQYRQQQLRFL